MRPVPSRCFPFTCPGLSVHNKGAKEENVRQENKYFYRGTLLKVIFSDEFCFFCVGSGRSSVSEGVTLVPIDGSTGSSWSNCC
ncbi:hypothetical protein STEG23_019801 [Scotinomys teguina]